MKTFIVGGAMFLLLMFFPLQYVLNTYNTNLKQNVDLTVNKYVQEARINGRFTADMIQAMKAEISAKTNISEDKIITNVTTIPKYRKSEFNPQEFIEYDIRVPIPKILAMGSYFNIDPELNKTVYPRIGIAASEVLPE